MDEVGWRPEEQPPVRGLEEEGKHSSEQTNTVEDWEKVGGKGRRGREQVT